MSSRYHEVYRNSQEDPEGFWAEAAGAIDWFSPWNKVFDPDQGIYGRWYIGATTNMCHNAVDRHVSSGAPTSSLWFTTAPSPAPRPVSPITRCSAT